MSTEALFRAVNEHREGLVARLREIDAAHEDQPLTEKAVAEWKRLTELIDLERRLFVLLREELEFGGKQ